MIREYLPTDLPSLVHIWNQVVEDGNAFPQMEPMTLDEASAFFAGQSFTAAAQDDAGRILGLYILHPNNVGRCGHIANASYAVAPSGRGKGVGEALVRHSLVQAKELGFRILQFNAVVKTNLAAIRLYQKLGFTALGVIPKGFLKKDGSYEDIVPFYHPL